jgi:hypothetical protein
MGQAKASKFRTDYDPAKLVSIAMVFSDWTIPQNTGIATFHCDVETTAIDAIASKLKGITGAELASGLCEGFLANKHLDDTENFAHMVCAYVGQTKNYQKMKGLMPNYNGFWVKVAHNGAINQSIARPAMLAPRDVMLEMLEQVRSKGASSLTDQQFLDFIGTPQEPDIMNGFDPRKPPIFTSVGIEDFAKPGEGRPTILNQGVGQGKGQHGSTLLTGRWYTKH